MLDPGSGISVVDGLTSLAGVRGIPAARRGGLQLVAAPLPVSPTRPCRDDCVELSPEARRASLADTAQREQQLNEDELRQVQELRERDQEVRIHEQAHKAAAGPYAGPIAFTYTTGPDGARYAVGGEVPIDVTPVLGDPEATVAKMQQVRRAALAPAHPSDADRQVAVRAQQEEDRARAELNGHPPPTSSPVPEWPGQHIDVTA